VPKEKDSRVCILLETSRVNECPDEVGMSRFELVVLLPMSGVLLFLRFSVRAETVMVRGCGMTRSDKNCELGVECPGFEAVTVPW